jgi:hypothetical protein
MSPPAPGSRRRCRPLQHQDSQHPLCTVLRRRRIGATRRHNRRLQRGGSRSNRAHSWKVPRRYRIQARTLKNPLRRRPASEDSRPPAPPKRSPRRPRSASGRGASRCPSQRLPRLYPGRQCRPPPAARKPSSLGVCIRLPDGAPSEGCNFPSAPRPSFVRLLRSAPKLCPGINGPPSTAGRPQPPCQDPPRPAGSTELLEGFVPGGGWCATRTPAC